MSRRPLTDQLGEPPGFPRCGDCPYRINGPTRVCVRCATAAVEPIADLHCPTCSQRLDPGDRCRNRLCAGPRSIDRIRAIATYSGDLADSIKRLKYRGKHGWAYIFGRLVTGYLDATTSRLDVDLIVPNPTWTGSGRVQHTEEVLRHAAREDLPGRWPFHPDGVLVKTGPTPKSAGLPEADKAGVANALPSLMEVHRPDLVRGRRVVVYDDVCTTGRQLDALARLLKDHGAARVEGLVLARTPWNPTASGTG